MNISRVLTRAKQIYKLKTFDNGNMRSNSMLFEARLCAFYVLTKHYGLPRNTARKYIGLNHRGTTYIMDALEDNERLNTPRWKRIQNFASEFADKERINIFVSGLRKVKHLHPDIDVHVLGDVAYIQAKRINLESI